MALELLFPHFDELVRTPEDVQRLNEAILQLAVQGKLVPQDPEDQPANELLRRIETEKMRLFKEGKIEKPGVFESVRDDEVPYDIPSNWQWVRLPAVSHTWGQKKPDEKFVYIDVSSIDPSAGVIKQDLSVIEPNEAPSRARKVVRRGTVIYSTVRPYLRNIAIVDRDFDHPPIASTAFAIMHPLPGILGKFLFYYLRSGPFTAFVEAQMTGMAYPAVSDSKLHEGYFPLPPFAEQHRIVAKVDELFAQTRALEARLRQAQADIVTANRAALHRLHTAQDDDQFQAAWRTIRDHFDVLYDDPRTVAELRQAILDLAVRGKLVPQDPEDEPAEGLLPRITAEEGRSGAAKSLDSGTRPRSNGKDELLPYRLPKNWKWARVGEISNHRLGKMLDKHKNKGEYRPYLRNINVQWDRIDLSDVQEMRFEPSEFDEYQLRNGDLLICEGGEPGRCAIWSNMDTVMMFQKAIHRVRPYIGIIPRYLLFHFWADAKNGRLEKFFTGATIKHFTGKALADYPIALPPSAEQQRIVAKVDQLMRLCDALEAGLAQTETVRHNVTIAALQP